MFKWFWTLFSLGAPVSPKDNQSRSEENVPDAPSTWPTPVVCEIGERFVRDEALVLSVFQLDALIFLAGYSKENNN